MRKEAARKFETVRRLADIPEFKTEREESEFWAAHELSEELMDKAELVPEGILPEARPRTRPVAIRFDEATLRRLKRLSAHLRKGYQSLLKEFVVERLYEEERREGFIAAMRTQSLTESSGSLETTSRSVWLGSLPAHSHDFLRDRKGTISREEYTVPILEYLVAHGGRALTEDVCAGVGRQFEAHFTDADLRSRRSTPAETVWRNEVRWQAKYLKGRGLLHDTATSGRGTWVITDVGRQYLERAESSAVPGRHRSKASRKPR
jgi:hypothetical protein